MSSTQNSTPLPSTESSNRSLSSYFSSTLPLTKQHSIQQQQSIPSSTTLPNANNSTTLPSLLVSSLPTTTPSIKPTGNSTSTSSSTTTTNHNPLSSYFQTTTTTASSRPHGPTQPIPAQMDLFPNFNNSNNNSNSSQSLPNTIIIPSQPSSSQTLPPTPHQSKSTSLTTISSPSSLLDKDNTTLQSNLLSPSQQNQLQQSQSLLPSTSSQQQQQQQQPPTNPFESFFRYSQVLQLSVQSFQSLATHSLTLIQAFLMFKHEIINLFCGPSLTQQQLLQQQQHVHLQSTRPTLFQRLITQPISFFFQSIITLIDFIIRILTCNLIKIKSNSSSSSTSLHHLNQHMPYPYQSLQQQQLLTNTNQSLQLGPIIPNRHQQHLPLSTQSLKSSTKSSSILPSISFSTFQTLSYIGTICFSLYYIYKNSPKWLSSLESHYQLSPTTSTTTDSNLLTNNTNINNINLDTLLNDINFNPYHIHRTLQLKLLQKYNKIHPIMYNYYAIQNIDVELPNDLIDQLTIIHTQHQQESKLQQQYINDNDINNNNTNQEVIIQQQQPQPQPQPQQQLLPSLFQHIDTTTTTSLPNQHESNINITYDPEPITHYTLPQLQPILFENEKDGLVYTIDQFTGQVIATRKQPTTTPSSSTTTTTTTIPKKSKRIKKTTLQ